MLAAADSWIENSPVIEGDPRQTFERSRVLIVTENKETIEDSFKNDARTMGIDLDVPEIAITTYNQIGRWEEDGKELDRKYGLVIFDEAHNLKNVTRPTSQKALSIKSDKTVFATATPLDTPQGAAYFLSKITGIPEEDMLNSLGLQWEEDPMLAMWGERRLVRVKPWNEIFDALETYREQAIENGIMLRRVHPFFGEVISTDIEMSDAAKLEQDQMLEFWGKGKQTISRRGQRTLDLGRWEEAHKVPIVYDKMKQSLDDGKQVVVAVSTSGDQIFKSLSDFGGYRYVDGALGDREIRDGRYIPWTNTGGPREIVNAKIADLNRRHGFDTGLQPVVKMQREYVETEDGFSRLEEYPIWYIGRKSAAQLIKQRLEAEGISYSELTQFQKGEQEVQDFQSGKNRVMLMTPLSGGTGINLDDRSGDNPRHLIIASKGWSGDKIEQVLGRVSRKTPLSPSLGEFIGLRGGFADQRQNDLLSNKLQSMRSMTGSGERFDEMWDVKDQEAGGPSYSVVQKVEEVGFEA